jgi:hypothetical protein
VHWGCDYATTLNIEVDPQRRRCGRREYDSALQKLEECRAFVPERVRLVALRWHASGVEVRLGLQTQKIAMHAGGGPGARATSCRHRVP